MAKVLIGADLGSYSFNKTAKTITFSGFKPVLEEILLITDVTNGTIIYQFNDATKGGTLSGQVLTLTYNTNSGSFADTDSLQIFYWSEQPQSSSIDETSVVLKQILECIQNPIYYNRHKGSISVLLSESQGLLSVGNVANISYFNNSIPTNLLVQSSINTTWATTVRNFIT